MTHRLDMELDFITDMSPLELASKVVPIVQETIEGLRQSLGNEREFEIFLVLEGREVLFVMEPV